MAQPDTNDSPRELLAKWAAELGVTVADTASEREILAAILTALTA